MKSDHNMEDNSTNFDSNHRQNQETLPSFSLFENLPEELFQKVFSYCPLAKDRLNLMQVSGQFASSVATLETHEYPKHKYSGVATGNCNSFALTGDGRIFSCGNNYYGQLGQWHQQEITVFTEVPGLKGHHFMQIAGGHDHSLALTEDGRIFSCGKNNDGQLGQGDTQNRAVFTEVPGLKGHHFMQIAAGNNCSLALTEDGRIFSCGWNKFNQLGQGDAQNRAVFTEAPGLKEHHFIQIAAGACHNLALTKEGRIFSCGDNEFGQLGQDDQQHRGIFTKVPGLEGHHFIQIAGGYDHSIALTNEGKIFSCGETEFGELGQGDQQKRAVFTEVPGLEGLCFTQIAVGAHHNLALSEKGEVFSCGRGYCGALGQGLFEADKDIQPTFKKVVGLKNKVVGIAAGYGHSIVLTEEGQVFACGWSESGQLGLRYKKNQTTFQRIPNLRLLRVPLKLPETLKARVV